MRREFAQAIQRNIELDDRIIICSADLGYGMWDKIRSKYNNKQFYCFGASEFASLSIACGLASCGKIPIFYSITPFALYRPAEIIRLYMNHDKFPAKIIGSGRDFDYNGQGISHCMPEDKQFMKLFPNVKSYWPKDIKEMEEILPIFLYNKMPSYLNLKR